MNNYDLTFEIQSDIDEMDFMIPEGFEDSLKGLSEAESEVKYQQLKLEINDVEKFIKLNDCKPVTNPIFFSAVGVPTPDGLLSNEIFGVSKASREGVWAYIDLNEYFLDPSCYKNWCRIDSTIKNIVHRTNKYIIDENGRFVEDEEHGKNGVKFLKDNFDKLSFRKTDSIKRDIRIQYLNKNKDRMFITKYLVIPAYYRDMNTKSDGKANVGAINKIYASLLASANSLKSTKDMGFDNTGAICGRIQEILVEIYDWFVGNTNSLIKEEGTGISKKKGILKRANLSKTADYSSRLVISAQELKVESVDDIMVDIEHAAIPLSAMIADFKPFMMFNIKRFFESEFASLTKYPVINKQGKIEYRNLKDALTEFSDERIEKEMHKYLHGYSNRLIPIEVPIETDNPKEVYYMAFKGRSDMNNVTSSDDIYHRPLTWMDIFYMAAVESAIGKTVLLTRFPIDSRFNQTPCKIIVSSTKQTEPLYINGKYYKFYPKIRKEDILSDTSNMFVDTLQMSNLLLAGFTADFDGDQLTVKGVYTQEANDELSEYIMSKANFITGGASNIRKVDGDPIMTVYSLTRVLDDVKLTNPVFK